MTSPHVGRGNLADDGHRNGPGASALPGRGHADYGSGGTTQNLAPCARRNARRAVDTRGPRELVLYRGRFRAR